MRWVIGLLGFACLLGSQPRRELRGRLVRGDGSSPVAVPRVKVVLNETGSQDVTDDNGNFHLFLPDAFGPGREITITVSAPGLVVRDPPGGRLRIPADLLNLQQIELLPNDPSKLAKPTPHENVS